MKLSRFLSLTAGMVLAVLTATTSAQVLLNETFDDDTIGTLPNTSDFIRPNTGDRALGDNGPGSDLEVIGPGSTYTDPFGPAGNKSLVLDNFNGGSANPNDWPFISWYDELGQVRDPTIGGGQPPLPGTVRNRAGTIEFDLYLTNDIVNGVDEKYWTYVDLRIGFDKALPNTVGDTIIYSNFRVQDGVSYFFFDAATAPSNGHPLLADTAQHVKYTIFSNETYTLEVGGNFIEKSGSKFIPWRTGGPNTGFNVFSIGSAFGPGGLTNKPFYIDNLLITAVPEPATIAVGALAGAVLMLRGRRR
jgi:hypothetical protein